MASRVVELTPTQSIVLGTITHHKCISAGECSYRTNISIPEIEAAIPVLEKHRLIYLSAGGGFPKRWCPRAMTVSTEKEVSEWGDPDAHYEKEAGGAISAEEVAEVVQAESV